MSQPSLALERSKAVICRNLFNDPSELLSIDRFELVRTLGSGGSGMVYEARDPLRDEHVALKMLNGRGAGDVYRLKREFRALVELAHPNLVVLHELNVARQHAFFTMELIAGQDIVSYIRRGAAAAGPPPDDARLRSALGQLCEGIRVLHLAGKLHRDLKPSNVLVTETGRVVLLDFGLVQDVREPSGAIEGTPAYMAPEQRKGKAGESSDWYAFGRILQQALHGSAAFGSRRASERPGCELSRLAEQLLLDAPERRPGFHQVSSIVCGAPSPGSRAPSPRARDAHQPDGERFVGRRQELMALERAFAQSTRRPVLVLLRGESGIGKTTLMRRFVDAMLQGSDALVLSSRCYEREFVPYKALDSAIDELSRRLSARPRQQLLALGADDRRALLHLFPVLGRLPWLAPEEPAPEDVHPVVQRRRGFDALKKVFRALAAEHPVVLCIDDLQWSDADSGALLAAMLCDADAAPLLVLASDRTDPGRLNPATEELYRAAASRLAPPAIVELTLGALLPHDAARLARNLLADQGNTSQTMPALIAAESRGNPLFLKELSQWVPAVAAGLDGSTSIDSIVAGRARALSDAARRVLELIAIAGRPLSTAVIAQALGLSYGLHRLVLELRRARLVHVVRRADAELLELDHDRTGEAVLRTLQSARRHELHAQLARALDADGLDAEASVAQYIAADLPEKAAQRARQAGYLALGALAFSRAAWLFQQALELGRWPEATRAHLYGELALAFEHAGCGLSAAEAYRNAAALTKDPLRAAKLEAQAAEHLIHNGRPTHGFALLRHCFEILGMRWPAGRFMLLLSILKLLVVLQVRTPSRRRPAGAEGLRLARTRLLSEGMSAIEGYDLPRALHNALLALREAEAVGDPVWSARAGGTRGLFRCAGVFWGGAARGIEELEASCAQAQQLGDPGAVGELQLQLALGHYVSGNPRQALAWANRCEANLRLMPLAPRALYRVMGLIVNALHDLGELREAQRRWSAFAHEARQHSDVVTSFWTHAHPLQLSALFAADDRAGADATLEKQGRLRAEHPDFQLLAFSHAVCRVETELYWERPSVAQHMLALERPLFSATTYPFFGNLRRLLRARAVLAAAAQLPGGLPRARLLWRVWLDARVLSAPKQCYTRGAGLLLRAGVLLLGGRREHARRQLEAALAILDRSGDKLLAASARYWLGAFLPEGAERRALQRAAADVLTRQGVMNLRRWVVWTMPGFGTILGHPDD